MGNTSPFITAADCYLFGQGIHYEIYRKLGAHATVSRGESGVYFAVWAPRAVSLHVTGSFNAWDEKAHPMTRIADSGIFECFIPGVKPGDTYMYAIRDLSEQVVLKADPYAARSQLRPETASIVADPHTLESYPWSDDLWLKQRSGVDLQQAPLAIYEVHPGSWRQDQGQFMNYRRLAQELADHVLAMGYTHVELMGIAEHPFDQSWGYQVTGYYAPTARHGSPEDFMYLVDYLHGKGIGVILDWVPAHFPKDSHGLASFDGTPTYECADPAHNEQPDWGTRIFDYSRPQVTNFLLANALYWVEQFHVDGLRVDAVASMLYPSRDGIYRQTSHNEKTASIDQPSDTENPHAVAFLKKLNEVMAKRHPGVAMIAEDSTLWPQVTAPVEQGGLGFTFKWNMGWMHDFLDYLKMHPLERGRCHDRLTFGMTYAFREGFVLSLSHDEVVHLKRSLLSKMPGPLPMQVANLKVGYAFMMGHPGKKLLFMGQDFGQLREWDETRSLDWSLLREALHRQLKDFTGDLLKLYRQHPALYRDDLNWDGFRWINCVDSRRSIYSFVRRDFDGNALLFICNFTPVEYEHFRIGVPSFGRYSLILDETGLLEKAPSVHAVPIPCDDCPQSIAYPLAPYGIQVYRFRYIQP